jgi:hypothetical protein
MSKHPRLDDLVWFLDTGRDYAYRILNGYLFYRSIHETLNEFQRFSLLLLLLVEPPCSTDSKMCAGRVCNHQIPTIIYDVKDIALIVRTRAVRW